MAPRASAGSGRAPLGALAAIPLFAVLIQPLLAASTVTRGFEPAKVAALTLAVGALLALGLLRGERMGMPDAPNIHRRVVLSCAFLAVLGLTLGLAFAAGDRWTALLGGMARRQGWVTEIAELGVLLASFLAASRGSLPLAWVFVAVAFVSAGVSSSGVAQSHWVNFLDPTRWEAEVFNRVAGTVGNPSLLSTYLGLTLPLLVGLGVESVRAGRRRLLFGTIAATGFTAVALVFARGRAGAAGALAGLLVLVALLPAHSTWGRRFRALGLSLAALVCAFVVALNIPGSPLRRLAEGRGPAQHLLERLAQLTNFQTGAGRVRALLADGVQKSFEARPSAWLTGFGPDLAWDALAPFDSVERERTEGVGSFEDRPHQFATEKVMSGGVAFAAAWLVLLVSAASMAMARAGVIRSPWRIAVGCSAVGAVAFLGAIAAGSVGYAGAVSVLAAAVSLIAVGIGIGGFAPFSANRVAGAQSPGAALWAAVSAAIVSHLVAGSFSVSTPAERTLVWVIVGCALAAPREGSAVPSAGEPTGPWAPPCFPWLAGAAACALIPYYAFHAFRWDPNPQPLYAALLVPAVLLCVGASLCEVPWGSYFARAIAPLFVGVGALSVLAWCGGGPPLPQLEHGAMSWVLPIEILWMVAIFCIAAALEGPRAEPATGTWAADLRPVAAGFLACATAGYLWIAVAEMRSDTTYFAALQLSQRAVELDNRAYPLAAGPQKAAMQSEALRLSAIAHGFVEAAKERGAPLRPLGCRSPFERVIESARP